MTTAPLMHVAWAAPSRLIKERRIAMCKLLISVVLLSLPIAVLADTFDRDAGRVPGRRWGDVCCTIERLSDAGAEDISMCRHPATKAGGFPLYATKGVLRWREAPAHKAWRPLPPARWI
jgi:hypothetical protein